MKILCIALGGALGAFLRYEISLLPLEIEFPFLTFITNLAGAFLIGFVTGLAEKYSLSENLVAFLKTGFCGGFTTFSTFSLESYQLLENKSFMTGGLYMMLSVLCCLSGVWLGNKISAL